MMPTPYEEIEQALEILDLPKLVTKADIKRQYRHIAKQQHPDIGGDPKKMEEINHAYKLLMKYIEEIRYTFDKNEISKQFPGAQHAEQFKP
jgi:DnaJ-class molecular chaperone